MFEGLASRDKDPRKSLHVDEVATPEVGPGEAIVAVMASSVNFNTVWTSIFEPVSTFGFLERYGRLGAHQAPRPALPRGRLRPVRRRPRRRPRRHQVEGRRRRRRALPVGRAEDHQGHDDSMMDPQQRIWGFETNFGGLAELALVKANQLMPKPPHLTWEEAVDPGLVNCTAYRKLVRETWHHEAGRHRADRRARGGLGAYAIQYVRNGGGVRRRRRPPRRQAEICRR